jgi:ATP adenylyltransferase
MSPAEILNKLGPVFEKAQAEGDLLFFPSTIVKHSDAGIEVSVLASLAWQAD